jgi:hypothetical protein
LATRRWVRFSLRTLLAACGVAAVGLGVLIHVRRDSLRQAYALREIEKLGGRPFRLQEYRGHLFHQSSNAPPLRSKFYRLLLGEEYFTYAPVIVVDASVTAANLRAMIPHLERVRIKEGCNNGETYLAIALDGHSTIDDVTLDWCERRLPRCRVLRTPAAPPGQAPGFQ